jgi:hypothetical protein
LFFFSKETISATNKNCDGDTCKNKVAILGHIIFGCLNESLHIEQYYILIMVILDNKFYDRDVL